jgi:integrase
VFFGTLVPMFDAAVTDRRIGVSPCAGMRLPKVPDAKDMIPRPDEVHALARALPERYRAIVYLAAGGGWRGGEIFGLERDVLDLRPEGPRTATAHRDHRTDSVPRAGVRTNELPAVVVGALRAHLATFPVCPEEIEDETEPRRPTTRHVRLHPG